MNTYSDIHIITAELTTQAAALFRALADPTRVRLLVALQGGELHVGALAQAAGVSESAVSHHLHGLRLLRVVQARKQGRHVFYRLDDEHVEELLRCALDHAAHG